MSQTKQAPPRARTRPSTRKESRPRSVENRFHLRFNKAFPVLVVSELYGETAAVARNVSAGGIFVEMADPLPLGAVVTICFRAAGGGDLSARGEVKHHYCFNYGGTGAEPGLARGIGVRFLEFFPHGERPIDELLSDPRCLH